MTKMTTCPHCGADAFPEAGEDGYSCGTECVTEWGISRTGMCYQNEIFQLKNRAEKARAELERIYAGLQGSCYCCEPVGEMNQKLEAEVKRLRQLLLVSDLPVALVNSHYNPTTEESSVTQL